MRTFQFIMYFISILFGAIWLAKGNQMWALFEFGVALVLAVCMEKTKCLG